MAHDPGRKALELLRAERFLRDRGSLDQFGVGAVLHEDPELHLPHLEGLAEGIVSMLPPDLRPVRAETEDNTSSWVGTDELTVLQFTPYRGVDGRAWIGAVAFSAVPWKFTEEELDVQKTANLLNVKHPGRTFVNMANEDLSLAVVADTAVPSEQAGGVWQRIVALLYAGVYETNHRMLEPESSVSSYVELEEVAAVERGTVFTIEAVAEATKSYHENLPGELKGLVRSRFDENNARLFIPFHTQTGARMMELGMFCVPPGAAGMGAVEAGFHLYSIFPVRLDEEAARTWCDEANGGGEVCNSPDDQYRRTTPWKLGNWKWHEEGPGRVSLVYSGHVPNRMYGMVRIEEIIDGVVKELWSGWDRHRVREEFDGVVNTVGES